KKSILAPDNFWCAKQVERMSLLIDAHAYFKAFLEVARKARHSIVVTGWEVDARLLINPTESPASSLCLRSFLNQLCTQGQKLSIYLYSWKSSFYLRFGRERFERFK